MMFLMGQMLFCLLLAFVLGFCTAWFWRRLWPAKTRASAPEKSPESDIWRKKYETLHKEHSNCKTRIQKLQENRELTVNPAPNETSQDWHTPYQVALARAQRLQVTLSEREAQLQSLKQALSGDHEPVNLFKTKPEQVDNLEEISGVGPALHTMLNQLGIYQFQQIAAFTPQEVAWVASNLKSFKNRITRDDWVSQAKNLQAAKKHT